MTRITIAKLARNAALIGGVVFAGAAVAQPAAYPPPGGAYGGGAPGQAPAQPQGYYSTQPIAPTGFQPRRGLLIAGVGFGLGSMGNEAGAIECADCDTNPVSFAGDVRLGGMLSERLGLMVEGQIDSSVVQSFGGPYGTEGTKSISQTAVFVAAQYHVSPRLYVRGGLGLANLAFDYSDSYGTASESISAGSAVMGAVGYELISTRGLSLDVVGRLTVGTYTDIGETVSAGSIGLAFNYF